MDGVLCTKNYGFKYFEGTYYNNEYTKRTRYTLKFFLGDVKILASAYCTALIVNCIRSLSTVHVELSGRALSWRASSSLCLR